jgi:hypothetical protein
MRIFLDSIFVTFQDVRFKSLGSESCPGIILIPKTLESMADRFPILYISLLNVNVAIP